MTLNGTNAPNHSRQGSFSVLLVDDLGSFRERLAECVTDQLQALNQKPDVVPMSRFDDAKQAIKNGSNGHPWDLLITDVHLNEAPPVQDQLGLELVEAAQKLFIPTIALSATPHVTTAVISECYTRFGLNRFRFIHKNRFRSLLPAAITEIAARGRWISENDRQEPTVSELPIEADLPVVAALREMRRVSLKECTVVGDYRRYDPSSREALLYWKTAICDALERDSNVHQNFLIWARAGGGKTYFVEQIAAELGNIIRFVNIDVSKDDVSKLEALQTLDASQPVLCLLDEIDSPKTIQYETIRSYLDMNLKSTNSIVFVLVGSKIGGSGKMREHIESLAKGPDVLSRVPAEHRFDVPAPTIEDTVVIMANQAVKASRALSAKIVRKGGKAYQISRIQKSAIYFVLVEEAYRNVRQLCTLTSKAVERAGAKKDLMFDDMFLPNSVERYSFAAPHISAIDEFWNSYLNIDE